MARLRAETRAQHQATEGLAFSRALIAEELPLHSYVGQLRAYAKVHAALESACGLSSHPVLRSVWRGDMVKMPRLAADLAHFRDQPELSPDGTRAGATFAYRLLAMAQENPVALLGPLYVLEGSTLGSVLLRRHLSSSFGVADKTGMSYYSAYGNEVMQNWRTFKTRVDGSVRNLEDQDSVVLAAREAFGHIGSILRGVMTAGPKKPRPSHLRLVHSA